MEKIKTPVCVLGSGPAGATASIFLTRYGIEHLLIDREEFPRDKFCGEVFWGRVRYVLDEMGEGVQADMESKGIIKKGIDLSVSSVPSKRAITLENPDFIHSRRMDFDFYLHQKATQSRLAQFRKAHISKLSQSEKKVIIETQRFEIEADLALVCMGEKQSLLKQWLPQYKSGGRKVVAFRRYYREAQSDLDVLNFQKRKPYPTLLINTLPGGMTLAEMYIYQDNYQKSGLKHDAIFQKLISDSKLVERFERAELISDWQATSTILSDLQPKLNIGRVLLCGSSMGAIHPMTGKGVGLAMRSGQIAAFWAAQSVRKNDFSSKFLSHYHREIKKRMGADFFNAYAEYLAQILFHNTSILSIPPKPFAQILKLIGMSKVKVKGLQQ
jgi:flavin-dependent dehydrogenase